METWLLMLQPKEEKKKCMHVEGAKCVGVVFHENVLTGKRLEEV